MPSIAGFARFLHEDLEEASEESAKDYLRRISSNTERMGVLIRSLLEYSSIETKSAAFTDVDLNEVLYSTLDSLADDIGSTGGTVNADALPSVRGDEVQLYQLLQNLVSNAMKYHGKDPPVVSIYARVSGDQNQIIIEDNRIGIDARYHERIFEIFKRLHAAGDYPGTGIGLAVCKRIAVRHNGHLFVESEAGKGSAFIIELPSAQDSADDGTRTRRPRTTGRKLCMTSNVTKRARPSNVLLVEDDDSDAFLTQEGFRRARLAANLERVSNGEECLAWLRHEAPYEDSPTPDLVLPDLNMPIMDGREVLAEIVKDPGICHIPSSSSQRQRVTGTYSTCIVCAAVPTSRSQLASMSSCPSCEALATTG